MRQPKCYIRHLMAVSEATAELVLSQYGEGDPDSKGVAGAVHRLHVVLGEARDHIRNCEECETD